MCRTLCASGKVCGKGTGGIPSRVASMFALDFRVPHPYRFLMGAGLGAPPPTKTPDYSPQIIPPNNY